MEGRGIGGLWRGFPSKITTSVASGLVLLACGNQIGVVLSARARHPARLIHARQTAPCAARAMEHAILPGAYP